MVMFAVEKLPGVQAYVPPVELGVIADVIVPVPPVQIVSPTKTI